MSDIDDTKIDALLDRFDQAWSSGDAPEIRDYVPASGELQTRRALIIELIMIDLERRWRAARACKSRGIASSTETSRLPAMPTIEDYLVRYPELGPIETIPLDLIGEEYRVRQIWGDRPPHKEFLQRYPRRSLRPLLNQIDREYRSTSDTNPASTQRSESGTLVYRDLRRQDLANTQNVEKTINSEGPTSDSRVDHQSRKRRFGDYELINEIARGGMGVVYKARQLKLNRICALKMILSGTLAGAADIMRFQAEAESAACLDHPGIVPIYEVGEHAGQHYFSMGFVDGTSLQDQLREGPLLPRDAAVVVQKVAQAVAYAHSKGIVHRDLKPANVLVDHHGNPRVTDFGLAKRLTDDSQLTVTGQILGTPSFMPPEQAAGRTSEVNELSDVYSLGALLYALLTGRPPFQTGSPMETLREVLEKDPISAMDLNAQVPRDLETICSKCMQKAPGRRYPSALALSAELQRFLHGEPIQARPVSRAEKTWRWCKRNRVTATLMAVCAALLVAGTVSSSILAHVARRNASVARVAEAHAIEDKETAVELLGRARRAIDAWLTGGAEDLMYFPGVQQFRERLLQHAADDYEALLNFDTEDPILKIERAKTFARLGQLRQSLGDNLAAKEAFEKAIATYHSVDIDNAALAQGVAESLTKLGQLAGSLGEHGEAERYFGKANQVLVQELVDETDNASLINAQGVCLMASSVQHNRIGKFDEAESRLRDAYVAFDLALKISPQNEDLRQNYLNALQQLGLLLANQGRSTEANSLVQSSLQRIESLMQSNADPRLIECRATGHTIAASIFYQIGDASAELSAHESAVEDYQFLAAELPHIEKYHQGHAAALTNLGQLLHRMAENRNANECLILALEKWKQLTSDFPSRPSYKEQQAVCRNLLGLVCADRMELQLAREHLEASLTSLSGLVKEFEYVPDFKVRLAIALSQFGQLHMRMQNSQEALSALSIAAESMQAIVTEYPTVPRYSDVAANIEVNLAFCLREMDLLDGSRTSFRNAIQFWRSNSSVQLPIHRANLAWLLATCPDQELRDPTFAIDIATELVASQPRQARFYVVLSAGLLAQGEYTESLASLDQAEKQWGAPFDTQLYLKAAVLAGLARSGEAAQCLDAASAWMKAHRPGNLDVQRTRKLAEQALSSRP